MLLKTEFLAQELKQLVGWGASPKRLPAMPVLKQIADVDEEGSTVAIGYQMRRYLATEIDALSGTHRLIGCDYKAETIKRVYRLLLKVEGSGLSHERRRTSVMELLNIHCAVRTWRDDFGPEMDLMIYLADWMLQRYATKHQ